MSWLVASGARRAVALCLAILFALSCGESLIADLCDGDEGSEVAVMMAGRSAAPDASTGAATAQLTPAAHLDDSTSDHVPTDRPHGVHVCHCTHAHGGVLTLRTNVAAGIVPVSGTHDVHSERVPPSPALERQLRPPAVSQVA